MTNPNEGGPKQVPTKEQVEGIFSRFGEKVTLVRELYDEQGALYLLEAKVESEGAKEGEVTQYEYMREGVFPTHDSSKTAVREVYYMDGDAVGLGRVMVYSPETGEWTEEE